MRMKHIFFLLYLLFALAACDIADRDPLEPGLPQYTMTGKNSVGALINGTVWRDFNTVGWTASQSSMSIQYDTLSNKSRIVFSASLVVGNDKRQGAQVYFIFNDRVIRSKDDLILLNQTEWLVDGIRVDAGVESDYFDGLDCANNRGSVGKLYVRQAGMWEQDSENRYDVFSGTFGFTIKSDCGKLDVFRGRYDYQIGQIWFSPGAVDC